MQIGKVIVIGSVSVGKSQLIQRYVRNEFEDKPTSTVGVSFYQKEIQMGGQTATMNLWDTAGEERTQSLTKIYYKNAMAAIVVFDLTNQQTFDSIKFWVEQVRRNATCPFVLVGNKSDAKKSVSEADIQQVVRDLGCDYFETSALANTNVDQMFAKAASLAVDWQKKTEASRPTVAKPQEKAGCC